MMAEDITACCEHCFSTFAKITGCFNDTRSSNLLSRNDIRENFRTVKEAM
jgi:hypothetical protein